MDEISKKPESGELSTKETAFPESQKVTIPQQRRLSETNVLNIFQIYDKLITLANQKASFLMGGSGIVLGAAIVERSKILVSTEVACAPWLNVVIYLIAGLALFGVFLCCLVVIFPITDSDAKVGQYPSFIAYSHVAEMEIETFRSKLSSADYDFWDDLVHQTYQLAKIAARKFKVLKLSIWLSIISVGSVFTLFIMALLK